MSSATRSSPWRASGSSRKSITPSSSSPSSRSSTRFLYETLAGPEMRPATPFCSGGMNGPCVRKNAAQSTSFSSVWFRTAPPIAPASGIRRRARRGSVRPSRARRRRGPRSLRQPRPVRRGSRQIAAAKTDFPGMDSQRIAPPRSAISCSVGGSLPDPSATMNSPPAAATCGAMRERPRGTSASRGAVAISAVMGSVSVGHLSSHLMQVAGAVARAR